MVNLDVVELRPNLELENKYVDFSVLRTALSVATLIKDLQVALSEPSKEGECRGKCPKCAKERSFSFNTNNNRFNCFAKGCILKGGGVIDFFSKLKEVPAKEASHLLACAYGIQPYSQEEVPAPVAPALVESNGEVTLPLPEEATESLPNISQDTRQTAQYHIASIEQQLAQLKHLLAVR